MEYEKKRYYDDIEELTEVTTAYNATALLKTGWKLLAIRERTSVKIDNRELKEIVYIMGKKKTKNKAILSVPTSTTVLPLSGEQKAVQSERQGEETKPGVSSPTSTLPTESTKASFTASFLGTPFQIGLHSGPIKWLRQKLISDDHLKTDIRQYSDGIVFDISVKPEYMEEAEIHIGRVKSWVDWAKKALESRSQVR